jgi:hypothetical protein
MKTKNVILAWSIAAMSLTGMAFAQESATVTLRSGEKLTAQLLDLSGVGYSVRVNGQDRQIPANDVAAIDFTGGTVANADWDKLSGSGQILILKNGENITGQLLDIGGSSPLRLTFRTPSGERDFPSNEIARIVMARPANVAATATAVGSTGTTPTTTASAGGGLIVPSQQQWTPTGLTVRRGEWITFNATGDVRIGGEGNSTAGPGGSATARAPGSPLPNSPAGALVGRVGDGAAFLIGSTNRVLMPAAGQLFLGVNDGNLPDNEGTFQVQITREGGGGRRR